LKGFQTFFIILRNELRLVFFVCGYAFYALRLLASMPFFTRNPFRPTYFLPTAAKSKQKKPLEGNALHPIILRIKQGSIGFLKKHGFAQLNNLASGRRAGRQVWVPIIMDVLLTNF
jgi:hypothetical protein